MHLIRELLSSLLSFSGRALYTCLPRKKVVLLQSAFLAVSWTCILEDMFWSDFWCVLPILLKNRQAFCAEFQWRVLSSSVAAISNLQRGENARLAGSVPLWHSSIVLLDLCLPHLLRGSCIWIMSEAYYTTITTYHASYPRAPLFALVLLRTCIVHVSTEEEGGAAAPVRHLGGFMKILEDMFWSDFWCVLPILSKNRQAFCAEFQLRVLSSSCGHFQLQRGEYSWWPLWWHSSIVLDLDLEDLSYYDLWLSPK